MTQKIVALRIEKRGGVRTIYAIGQSPRGTKFILRKVELGSASADKGEDQNQVQTAITSLLTNAQ